jgi:hypothetical protein
VSSLEPFGSAPEERFDEPTSDLVFLVEYGATSPKDDADCWFRLQFARHDLLGRTLDLAGVSAVHNPYFPKAVAKGKLVLHAA